MTARTPYFRLHGQPGSIYVSFVAGNGERTWVTAQGGGKGKQGYSRRREAYRAIKLFCGPTNDSSDAEGIWRATSQTAFVWHDGYRDWLPIRDEVAKRRTAAA